MLTVLYGSLTGKLIVLLFWIYYQLLSLYYKKSDYGLVLVTLSSFYLK